jgi:hypothetical protein
LVANQCNCHFSPPLAVAAAGAPVCVPIYILSDYEGTVNLGTGSWDNPLHVAAVIHLGGTSDEPCPLCMGDTVKDDGVRDGTCSSGIRIGGACDVNGYHPTWGPISIDCQPVSGANISGQGLVLNFPLTSGTSVLESTLPCDNPSDRLCPCRVCSGSDQIGCRNDAECAAAGAGTCTGTAGIGVSPNGCSDFNCGPDGTCPAGPVDQFCDGKVHPSGRGYVTCTTNADCQALDAGTCSIEQRRRCFLDPLVAVGKAGLFESDLAGQACLGATTSIAINAASGLPGPVNVDVFNEYHATCAVDSSVTWEPPTGANCLTAGTTLPPQACADSFPLCGGACPPGLECAMDGLTCTCQPPVTTTTTTMPPAPCNETFPLCGGQCPLGQTCTLGLVTCNCQ